MNKDFTEIFILCESNVLASGETEFYVDAYSSCEQAEKDMAEQAKEWMEENEAHIVYDIGKEILLEDKEGNKYKFWIEVKGLIK